MHWHMLGNGNKIYRMKMFKNVLTIITLLLVSSSSFNGQGLFGYFKWTAYSDGAERIDHIVVDLSHNRFLTTPDGIDQAFHSIGMSVYGFHDQPINQKSTLSLAIGFGFNASNFHTNGRFAYTANDNNVVLTEMKPLPTATKYFVNKLNLNYLDVPVELRIRTMKASVEDEKVTNFRLYLGFKAGILVNDHTKYSAGETKVKTYRIKNVMEYRYGPTIRIGFKKIALQGFYSLTPIFKEGLGPQMYPISIGLTWIRM